MEAEYKSLKAQADREDSVPQAVRRYLHEMDQLTELAKTRMDALKVTVMRTYSAIEYKGGQ